MPAKFDGGRRQAFRAIAIPPGTEATHTPTGLRVRVAWESNGPRGLKGPWYFVSFPKEVPGVTQWNGNYHMGNVHGSTLSYAGRVTPKENPSRRSRGTWSALCRSNGCQFLREGLTKREAEREATSHMNAAGHDTTIVDMGARPNPPLVVLGNPGKSRGSQILSKNIISIRYQHAADGDYYEHKFKKGSVIELLPDGSIRVFNPRGVKLWGDY